METTMPTTSSPNWENIARHVADALEGQPDQEDQWLAEIFSNPEAERPTSAEQSGPPCQPNANLALTHLR